MQVFALPRHLIRNAGAASRLLGAKTPDIEAQRRRDAVARWRRAIADGLTTEQAAKAVGYSRATLYRWEAAPELRSRRPHQIRKPTWTPALAQAVEDLRADNPMWGKRKLAALLRREDVVVSVSTVGRILRKLMDRGVVVPVPTLRRNPGRTPYPPDPAATLRTPAAKGPQAEQTRRDRPDRHAVHQHPARQAHQALHRLRSRRQMDLRPCRHQGVGAIGRRPARQADQRGPVPRHRHPGRRRIRVQGRLRTGLRRQGPHPLRFAAEVSPAQRRRRTQPRRLALRVLRLLRPAPSHRQAADLRRRLRPSLQSP